MRVCFLTKSRLSKYKRATAISSEVPCKSIKKNHRKSISDFLQRGSSDFFCFCVFQLTIIYILKGSIWFQCVRSKMMQFFRGGVIRERSIITSARLGGLGGLSQNGDTADALEGSKGV